MSVHQHPITPTIVKRPFGGREIPGEPLTKRIRLDRHVEESRLQQQAPPKQGRAEVHDPINSPPLNLLHFSQIMSGLPPMTSKKGKERAQSPVASGPVVDPHDLDAETLKRCFVRDMQRYRAQINAEQVPVTPLRAIPKLLIEPSSFESTQSFIDDSSKNETKQSYRRRNIRGNNREKNSDDVLSRSQRIMALKADIMAAIDLKVKQNREHRAVRRGSNQCPIVTSSEQHNSHISDTEKTNVNSRENSGGRLGGDIDLSICSNLLRRAIPDGEQYQDDLMESSRQWKRSMSPPPEETQTKYQDSHGIVSIARITHCSASRGDEDLGHDATKGKGKRSISPSAGGFQEGNQKNRTKSAEEDGLRQQLPSKVVPERQQGPEHSVSLEHPVTSLPHLSAFQNFTLEQRIVLYDLTVNLYEHRERLAKLTLDRTRLQFELSNQKAKNDA
ncbi:hypothetical protein PTTW11_10357 [Pyrenophora teres f. teres]|uniref:Uncharacterized protein n=1 Tax=Pyrenophora teres f. teres TaxID=97479 RepID=A0A6S6WDT4_9PLEO|nr:hypothetical protein PTTW11_10357 [Pyrenophora teres f. teres]